MDAEMLAHLAVALAIEITRPIGQRPSKAVDVTWIAMAIIILVMIAIGVGWFLIAH